MFCGKQVLFNDTIFHNIHYGRLSATKEEVYLEVVWHFRILIYKALLL